MAALEKDYSFKSLRRNPPSGASNVKEAANEMKDRILSVSSSVRAGEHYNSKNIFTHAFFLGSQTKKGGVTKTKYKKSRYKKRHFLDSRRNHAPFFFFRFDLPRSL